MQINQLPRALAMAMASDGVAFADRCARCPVCGAKMQTLSSGPRPQDTAPRVRSHKCRNTQCLLAVLGLAVKSVEG